MTAIVKRTNFFIDTSRSLQNDHASGSDCSFNLQPAGITAGDDESIRLVLKQMSLYKNWPNINVHNSVYKLLTPASGTEIKVTIPNKNYASIKSLTEAFANSLISALITAGHFASASTVINNPTGTDIDDDTDNIISFTSTTNTAHGLTAGNTKIRMYISDGDAYELLGAKRINNTNGVDISMTLTVPTTTTITVTGFYPAQLTTEAYLYLRTDIQNDALESGALSARYTDETRTINQSSILGKIPLDRSIVSYDAVNEEFFINITTKHLTHMSLRLTDSYDRDIPQIAGQDTYGNLSFNCLLEIQIHRDIYPNPNRLKVAPTVTGFTKQSGFLSALNHGDTRLIGLNK
jgi:hypothetical protein